MRVVITGSSGLVGSRIIELLGQDIEFIPLSQHYTDITNHNDVRAFLHSHEYDMLLHLAAYTNVDQAEKEPELAYAINVTGTKNLIESNGDKPFIYISTGFVFSGNDASYDESSLPNPISVYGKTKYEGEKIVLGKGAIIRIEYPYRSPWNGKKDFVARIRELLASGKVITGITDSLFTPTYIDDIARGLLYSMQHYSLEIFHLVGSSSLSPFDAALHIASSFGLSKKLVQATTYDAFFSGKAKRPKNATIVSVKNTFCPMRSFEEGLEQLQMNNK